MKLAVVLALACMTGCRVAGTFVCARDEQCRQGGNTGQCAGGFCAFEDPACESRFRFDESAPAAGECADCSIAGNVWYTDADGDGHGDRENVVHACVQPAGAVPNADDCNDEEMYMHPGRADVCDGLDNDCSPITNETCTFGCMPARRPPPDAAHTYLFCGADVWAAASSACSMWGFRLARIDDATENAWIVTTRLAVINKTESWSGANDMGTEGAWRWEDGTQFWQGTATGSAVGGLYSNWTPPNEPNDASGEDCSEVTGNGTWNDINCIAMTRPFVCER
jgi:hypothetical protein